MKHLRAIFPALVLVIAVLTAIQEPASNPAIRLLPRTFHPVRSLAAAGNRLLNSIARSIIGAAETIAEHGLHFTPELSKILGNSDNGVRKVDSIEKRPATGNSAIQKPCTCNSILCDVNSAKGPEKLNTNPFTAKLLSDWITSERCSVQAATARAIACRRLKGRKLKLALAWRT